MDRCKKSLFEQLSIIKLVEADASRMNTEFILIHALSIVHACEEILGRSSTSKCMDISMPHRRESL